MNYQKGKQEARELAMHYQSSDNAVFWGQLVDITSTLSKLAKRFGLIREFKENGII